MDYIQLRKSVLLSAQRALLGAIYPNIRAIAIGFDGVEKLTIKMFLDRIPTEEDYDELSAITSEIYADIQFNSIEELCEYTIEKPIPLNGLNSFVYSRKE